MSKHIIINNSNDFNEVVVRTGEALPAKAPKSINIIGTLAAPWQFLMNKIDLFKPNQCHLLIESDKGKITFKAQDTDPYTEHVIVGQLKKDSRLESFGINTTKRYSVAELTRFIKLHRYFFASKEVHKDFLLSLSKWSAKVENIFADHNDNKGNSLQMIERKVTAVEGLIQSFDLLIPIYQGYSPQKFTVEIGLDPKNTEVQIYLLSDELTELEDKFRDQLIESELKNFDDFDCSKVQMS